MSDLIERLLSCGETSENKQDRDCYAAGIEIAKLRASNRRLRGVLENIRDHAISNGEDCAYLDASEALKETE